MNWRQFFLLVALAGPVGADSGDSFADGRELLARVVANRPAGDLKLQARLWTTRDRAVPLEVLIQNRPAETRTIYRVATTELLVVQPLAGAPRFFLKGAGELRDAARLASLGDSAIVYYDLGLGFLQWPVVSKLTTEKYRGRECYRLETAATDEPFARARLVVDREYGALLRAELINHDENVARRLAVTSFRKVGEVWIPRGIEIARVPPGQSLPSQEKSRIEIYDGSFDLRLPSEWFDEARFQ
jgi:hypothetical protein